jgi:hypothetical protein
VGFNKLAHAAPHRTQQQRRFTSTTQTETTITALQRESASNKIFQDQAWGMNKTEEGRTPANAQSEVVPLCPCRGVGKYDHKFKMAEPCCSMIRTQDYGSFAGVSAKQYNHPLLKGECAKTRFPSSEEMSVATCA